MHLHEDPRFAYFGWVGKFERKIADVDMVEHNAYVDALFVKLAQPTWKLHRSSIARVYKLCEELTKASRKKMIPLPSPPAYVAVEALDSRGALARSIEPSAG